MFKTAQYSQNRTENFRQHLEITAGAPFKVYAFNTKPYSKLHWEDFIPDLARRVRCRKYPKPTELVLRHEHSPQPTARVVCQSEPRVSQARLGAQPLLCAHGQRAPTASLTPAIGSTSIVTFGGPHQLFLFNAIKRTSAPFLQVLLISP